jgi:hypothetical protein
MTLDKTMPLPELRSHFADICAIGILHCAMNDFEGCYLDCMEYREGKIILYDSRNYPKGLSGQSTPQWIEPRFHEEK